MFSGVQGLPSLMNVRHLRTPVRIPPRQNFGVQVQMPAQTLVNTITIWVFLDGILLRPGINNIQ